MATEPKQIVTPEEYLRLDRSAPLKSEYSDGHMYAMAGGSKRHSRILTNLASDFGVQVLKAGCEIHYSELRLHVPATGLYTYPDIMVVCGDEKYLDEKFDTLLNLILIVEILSPSTEDYDRGLKFRHYRSIPTLREYLIVAQDEVAIEQWTLSEGHWTLTEYGTPDATVNIACLPDIQLAIRAIYRRVL